MLSDYSDDHFMKAALKEAEIAFHPENKKT